MGLLVARGDASVGWIGDGQGALAITLPEETSKEEA